MNKNAEILVEAARACEAEREYDHAATCYEMAAQEMRWQKEETG